MPLPNYSPRMSARSVYRRIAPTTKEDDAEAKKGRGRPRKNPLKVEKNVFKKGKSKVLTKKKRKITKRGQSKVEESSSEADCSSSEIASENDEKELKTIKNNLNEKNRTKRKVKSVNNRKREKDEASKDEEMNSMEVKGGNKNENDFAVEESEEEDVGNHDDEQELNDDDEDDDDNVLYSFADKKTYPVKKKRKLVESDESAIKSNRKDIECNGEDSELCISSNEVDMDDDLSSDNFSLSNNNEFLASKSHPVTQLQKPSNFNSSINDHVNRSKEFMNCSSSKAKISLAGIMGNSSSKAKISSYVEQNRTAKCGNFAAQEAFQWLISPVKHNAFFDVIYERKPYPIRRKNAHYYQGLFSCDDLETMIKENNLIYEEHIDVLKYENFERVHTSLKGKAIYSNVWDDFKEGYSIRVRNPQMYNKNLWNLCSLLQEYFSCVVGCNIYLTPPHSQGFPPHYDDIDAFIVQTGGSKKWKIYAPRNPNENLARYPSKDFSPAELDEPMLEITLNAGDFLYIPRGYIHQAETQEDDYSLHLTFSCNQLNTWGDLLLEALGKAMDHAILNEVDLRKSLPKDYIDYVGTAVSNMNFSPQRSNFMKEFHRLSKRCLAYLSPDESVDVHALKVLHTALPPVLSKIEKSHSIHGNGSHWINDGVKQIRYPKLNTKIQFLRRRNIRLIIEDGIGKVYHTFENERDPRPLPEYGVEVDHPFVEINLEEVPAFVFLLKHSPSFVAVKDLPLHKKSDKLSFVRTLYESGLLMTEEPLEFRDEDQSNSAIHERQSFQVCKDFI